MKSEETIAQKKSMNVVIETIDLDWTGKADWDFKGSKNTNPIQSCNKSILGAHAPTHPHGDVFSCVCLPIGW